MDMPTWEQFWALVRTPAGLGVIVVVVVGLLKRLDKPTFPAWVQKIGAWVSSNAAFVSIVVALIGSAIIFAVEQFGLESFFAKYFVIFALAWAASQGAYAGQKMVTLYATRIGNKAGN